jgi:hypothetical protein
VKYQGETPLNQYTHLKNEGQENKTGPVQRRVPLGGRRVKWKE